MKNRIEFSFAFLFLLALAQITYSSQSKLQLQSVKAITKSFCENHYSREWDFTPQDIKQWKHWLTPELNNLLAKELRRRTRYNKKQSGK